jgi:membrane-bound lytic murein transglycosylase A
LTQNPSLLLNDAAARQFFETYFTPYQIFHSQGDTGLLTGYYEASLLVSRVRTPDYSIPIRAKPNDLVMLDLGEFRDELRGQRLAGRVVEGRLRPYETRAEIEAGQLPKAQDRALFWAKDAVDVFFLQIQGSGILTLSDGTTARIGYDGQNGHVYTAIGKELIARGALKKEEVSMQTIRAWLQKNPDQAKDVLQKNQSYVFFRDITKDVQGEGPLGGAGLSLKPLRSLAIDRSLLPYGLPIYIDSKHPDWQADDFQQFPSGRISRLMIAQDTGGAIRGPVRGDFFWGSGQRAEHLAGLMKEQMRSWVLLPRSAAP